MRHGEGNLQLASERAFWDSAETGGPSTANEIRWKSKLEVGQISTRARVRTCFTCLFWTCGRPGPPALGGLAERARARARAKYKPKLQNNHFFVSKLSKWSWQKLFSFSRLATSQNLSSIRAHLANLWSKTWFFQVLKSGSARNNWAKMYGGLRPHKKISPYGRRCLKLYISESARGIMTHFMGEDV